MLKEAIKKRNYWIRKFKKEELFSISSLDDALNESLIPNRYKRKFLAPHFCDYINANYKGAEVQNYT